MTEAPTAAGGASGVHSRNHWRQSDAPPAFAGPDITRLIRRVREPVHVVRHPRTGHRGLAIGGDLASSHVDDGPTYEWLATLGPVYPEWLGDRTFLEAHRVRFPYVAGAMANGISTPEMVATMADAGMMGVFGAAGLSVDEIERGLDAIERMLGDGAAGWGANLIHSPNEPALEDEIVELYLRRNVRCVSASAFMKLTPALVRYACSGLRTDQRGRIVRPNRVMAKVSRVEVARRFMAPAPEPMLQKLVDQGRLTEREAALAGRVPVAEDITAEADSGGHTDNRPLTALLPAICAVRDEICTQHDYARPIRVGAAGGLGTPAAVASAFSLGAAYVLTGSVNQGAVESALSKEGRHMLAQADATDVAMAPSADMFEIGAKVQVLSRGTMFASRAQRLGRLYRRYDGLDELPDDERRKLEEDLFGEPLEEAWAATRRFWMERDPDTAARAERDPHFKMALLFRSYLGRASRWAIRGEDERRLDYQIWCGPAMGAFNRWADGSFLADPEQRGVVQIARNLLEGAAVVTRAQQVRMHGVAVPSEAFDFRPRALR